MGLLISFIKYSIDSLEKNLEVDSDLQSKLKNFTDLSEIEKKQVNDLFYRIFWIKIFNFWFKKKIIGDYKLNENIAEADKKITLSNILKNKIKTNKEDFKNLKALIEKNLHILWRHIEFYFHCFSNLNIQGILKLF